jgi:hypothetical protein
MHATSRHVKNSSHEKVFLVDGALRFVQVSDEEELVSPYSDHQIIMMSAMSTMSRKTFNFG